MPYLDRFPGRKVTNIRLISLDFHIERDINYRVKTVIELCCVPEPRFKTLERGDCVSSPLVLEGEIYMNKKVRKVFIALYNIHAVGHQTSHAVSANATHGLKIIII